MNVHRGKKPYVCRYCGLDFHHKTSCRNHEVDSHEKTDEVINPLKCKVCHKIIKREKYMRTHMKVHSGKKEYKCRYCDEEFALPQQRKNHEYGFHKEKPTRKNYPARKTDSFVNKLKD